MSDTSRQISPRRPAAVSIAGDNHTPASPARVEALRRLVAAGRYQVDAKLLARKICAAAGVAWAD